MLGRVELGGTAGNGAPGTRKRSPPRSSGAANGAVCVRVRFLRLPSGSARNVHRAARRGNDREGARASTSHPGDARSRASISSRIRCGIHTARGRHDRRAPPRAVLRDVSHRARRCAARVRVRARHAGRLAGELRRAARTRLLCGDGALRFADAFEPLGRRVELAGSAHASPSLSRARGARGRPLRARRVLHGRRRYCPMYLRQSDAELEWQRAGR
jgi:hypothetical protein